MQWLSRYVNESSMKKAVSMKNLAIIYFKGNAYRVNFAFMTINEASDLIKNSSNLNNKKGIP